MALPRQLMLIGRALHGLAPAAPPTRAAPVSAADPSRPECRFERVALPHDGDAAAPLLADGSAWAVIADVAALPLPRPASCTMLAARCRLGPLVLVVAEDAWDLAAELVDAGADEVLLGTPVDLDHLAAALVNGDAHKRLRLAARQDLLAASRLLADQKALAITRQTFYAQVLHDLKGPISTISGYCGLLSGAPTTLTDFTRTCVEKIDRNARRLLRMADDLAGLTRGESGTYLLRSETFFVLDELHATLWGHILHSRARGLDFQVELVSGIPDLVEADALRIRQILDNLVTNALKFTEIGRIGVRVEFQHGMLKVDVSDTGIGIAAARQLAIFQPHIGYDDRESGNGDRGGTVPSRPGMGLGLTVARHLARRLGGDLRLLCSTQGVGSAFRAELPVAVAASARPIVDPTERFAKLLEH